MKPNASIAQRKQIIKPTKEELSRGYQIAPIRQILSLKLSPFQQILMLNFFSHDYSKYRLSINSISKSFGNTKNRFDIVKALNVLSDKGYLIITDYTYQANMGKINDDYQKTIVNQNVEYDSDANSPETHNLTIADSPVNTLLDSSAIISPDSSAPTDDSIAINNPDSPDINNKRNIKHIYKAQGESETHKGNGEPYLGAGINPESTSFEFNLQGLQSNAVIENEAVPETPLTSAEVSSVYFNDTNIKMIWKLYIDNQRKYSKYSFHQFEKLMLISIITRLQLANKLLPENYEELQSFSYMINLFEFDLTIQLCVQNDSKLQIMIKYWLNQYSRTPVAPAIAS